jgi:adenosylcobinamide kinase/adenosylcobinamide-phosphate guanylyltransferase
VTARLDRSTLMGTAAMGWPVPGCGCVTCIAGDVGLPFGLDLDGAVMLDGPILPDRSITGGQRPAPLGATRLATGALADTHPDARDLSAGDRVSRDGLRIVALPGGTGSGGTGSEAAEGATVAVVSDGEQTWLWSPGGGPLPADTLDALAGAGLAAAVVDVRDAAGHPAAEHAAHRLADLRRTGALADGARVLAVGLSHHGAATTRIETDLAGYGIVVVPPGGRPLDAAPSRPWSTARPGRTLVLGGAASGKSRAAEAMLAAEPEVEYAATGPDPDRTDSEWAAKVAAHRGRRPAGWRTVEAAGPGVLAARLRAGGPPLLVDSIGTWVAAVLDRAGAWDDPPGSGWSGRVEAEVAELVQAWRAAGRPVVAVGEEVGGGVVPATRSGRAFRQVVGELNRRLAEQSERTVLVVAGRTIVLAADSLERGVR